nr:hypothetical protein [Gracilibacillus boraciitolerans]
MNVQILILIAGLSYGQVLLDVIFNSYNLQQTINYHYYFLILLFVLLLLSIQHSWEFLIVKIENRVTIIEFKKRWNS